MTIDISLDEKDRLVITVRRGEEATEQENKMFRLLSDCRSLTLGNTERVDVPFYHYLDQITFVEVEMIL